MTSNRQQAWITLERLFRFGLCVLGSVFAISVAVALDRFKSAFGSHWRDAAPDAQLSALLFIVTFVLILLWYLAFEGELQMLKAHGEEFLPSLPNLSAYPMILGALLALLLFFSDDPLLYAGLFAMLKLVERIGFDRDVFPRIRAGLADARNRAPRDDSRREAWDIIEHYYFGHRHRLLWVIVVAVCLAALALAVTAVSLAMPLLTSLAYVLLLVSIVFNEVLYAIWRRQRNGALGDPF